MVLLHQIELGKFKKIFHYKSTHIPPYTYFPVAFCNRHEQMEGWDPISNQGKDTFYRHTSHPIGMKT